MNKKTFSLYNDNSVCVNAKFHFPNMADAYVQLVQRIESEIELVQELPSRGSNLEGILGHKLIIMGMIHALEVIADAPEDIHKLYSLLHRAELKARDEL